MNLHLDTLSNGILNIYKNNFPIYLRSSLSHFKKCIHKYYYYDLWLNYSSEKFNIDNIINTKLNNTKLNKGLNKQQTYLNPIFSNLQLYNPLDVSIVGFSFLNYFPKYKLLHIDFISLDKLYQGKGNGTFYLNYIIDKFYKLNNTNKNIQYLILECEDHLIKFYEKNGFQKINYKYCYHGIRLNLMFYKDNDDKPISYKDLYKIACFMSVHFSLLDINCDFNLIKKLFNVKYHFDYYNIIKTNKFKYHLIDNFKKR